MTKPRLIVVDDDESLGAYLVNAAQLSGYDAQAVNSVGSFLDVLAAGCPAVVIVDVVMPGTDGIELVRVLAARRCSAGIILTSGYDHKYLEMAARLAEGRGLWVIGILPKPIRLATVRALLEKALTLSPPDGHCPGPAPCPEIL